jgi:hypothetical protein
MVMRLPSNAAIPQRARQANDVDRSSMAPPAATSSCRPSTSDLLQEIRFTAVKSTQRL